MMVKKYAGIAIFIFFVLTKGVYSQTPDATWVVPEGAKGKVCQFKFTPETIKSGENVFQKNCKSCHGDPGKQNWIKLTPPPGDPASAIFQQQTDGEMLYRITNGKTPMPQFGNVLSEEERWDVISYFRSFNSGYVQPVYTAKAVIGGKDLKLSLYCNYKQKKLYVLCSEIKTDKSEIPAKGIDIQLNVKRYFGTMKLGEPVTSDVRGFALFDFPSDLPGGRFGILNISARVIDETGLINSNEANAKLAIGKPYLLQSLTNTRSMWAVRSKAPIWLIMTFSLSLIIVWGLIFYIIFSIRKLKQTT
jgi:cytochrome c5